MGHYGPGKRWSLDMSSLTEIQYLQIEPNEKGTHKNKVWCFTCFTCKDSSDEYGAFIGL